MFILKFGRGKPVSFAIVYSGTCCALFCLRHGLLYDRVVLYTSRVVLYYCRSSFSLASISSCLFISLTNAGYMLIVSSIVLARDNPISLDRVSKSSRNSWVHLIWNFLSFVMTYFLICMDIFVMTNVLSLHLVCHDIFVLTGSFFCHDTNISTIWGLSSPRPYLFANNHYAML